MTRAVADFVSGRRRPTLARAFAIVFVPAFAVIATWSLAMPRYSGPDEPSHVIHAAAVVRGQWIGTPIAQFAGFTLVRVPTPYADGLAQERCFQSPPTTPAACQPPWPTSSAAVPTATYTGRYPPLYYAVVGLPTLVTSALPGFYGMRLLGALLAALFLGLAGAVAAVWSRNRMLPIGILLAATPMTLYSAAVVNPSGLEICAALCLWVSGVVLVREHLDDPPAGLLVITAIAASTLVLARPISPLWLGVICLSLLAVGDARKSFELVRRNHLVQLAIGVVAVCSGLAVAWVLSSHSFDVQRGLVGLPASASAFDVLKASVRREGVWVQEMVGVFGSHETLAPLAAYLAWWFATFVVVVAALLKGGRRAALVLLALIAACAVVPIALQFLHARDLGIVWQGRYTLPGAVGVPILASVIVGSSVLSSIPRRWFAALAAIALPMAAFLSFAEALRRYAVGVDGPILFFHPKWQPVGGVVAWLVVNLLATSLLAGSLWWVCARMSESSPSRRVRAAAASHMTA